MPKRKLLPFILVGAFLLLAGAGLAFGWGLAGEPEAKSSPATASPSAHPDPEGKHACAMLANARVYGATGDHVLIQNVATAAKASTNRDIAVDGALLERRLATAKAAAGQPDQKDMEATVERTMVTLERDCERAGL